MQPFIRVLIILVITAGLWSCRDPEGSKILGGDEERSEEYHEGVIYFNNNQVNQVDWGEHGYRLTLGMYYQNYYVNINQHANGVLALRGVEGAAFDYGGLIYRDLAGVPPADAPQALIKFTFTNTQFMDLEGSAFRYFLDIYLSKASDAEWQNFAEYQTGATARGDAQAFHTALSTFLASLPQK